MARKKKATFSATKQVKKMARAALGTPPPARVAPGEKEKQALARERHKPTLAKLLADPEA